VEQNVNLARDAEMISEKLLRAIKIARNVGLWWVVQNLFVRFV
jgi:hypothetical protein